MPNIICDKDDCWYRNGDFCMAWGVEIDDKGYCLTFDDYTQDEDYQEEYYIAVKTSDGKPARAKKVGKKIEINGEEFFTDSPPSADEKNTFITHARTGFYCGSVETVKKLWEEFCKRQAEKPDVISLPLAEYDESSFEYVITDEKEKDNI